MIDFIAASPVMIERISFEVQDILAGDNRAVILGSLEPKIKWTGKIVKMDFAIALTVANGEIVSFQMLEDSFAVSQAARGWPVLLQTTKVNSLPRQHQTRPLSLLRISRPQLFAWIDRL
jgi:hypothetical protein